MFNSHWYKWGWASLALSQATKFVQFSSTGIIITQKCITGLFMPCTIFIFPYHLIHAFIYVLQVYSSQVMSSMFFFLFFFLSRLTFPIVLCRPTSHQIGALQLLPQTSGVVRQSCYVGWQKMVGGQCSRGVSHLGSASLAIRWERLANL